MTNSTQNPAQNQPTPGLRSLSALGLALFLVGAVLPIFFGPHAWIAAVRWAGLAAIAAGGWRRSLTYWIFFSMLLGAEIGLDRPAVAEHLRLLSDIFLRLIKVIVAPLILGTLITGIAGHGNLRSVGRIGLKSLVYFEVVTTIALFIGLAAINISRAGEGLSMTPPSAAVPAQHQLPRPPPLPCTGTTSSSTSFPRTSRNPSPRTKSCRSPSSPCCSASRSRAFPKRSASRF